MDQLGHTFSTHLEFEAQLRALLARAQHRLQMFDPDFALWHLGSAEVDGALRRFLGGHGTISLVAHQNSALERDCPRFMRLLKDFSHAIECRVTGRDLRHLTDSFCIADDRHIVRRFHCGHMRGEAVFDAPAATQLSAERFGALWLEAAPGLHASTLGL